jgi:SAM-dependent methyltransferase
MNEDVERRARSFGGVAESYHRGRPGYGADAAAWLTGPAPLSVLELGAGTGKLTADLVAMGHDVHATDPDSAMLDVLAREVLVTRTSCTTAEEIPAADATYDVVVAAQCFHWFDPDRALAEIARVLKPGGRLSLAWNLRDERIPWVRKLGRVIGSQESVDSTRALRDSDLFGDVEEATFSQWQVVDRNSIQDLMLSRSNIAVLDDAERERRLADLMELYDDYGRGMDGMQVPYRTTCFRAEVAPRVVEPPPPPPIADDADPLSDSAATLPRVVLGGVADDDAVLLIDFR